MDGEGLRRADPYSAPGCKGLQSWPGVPWPCAFQKPRPVPRRCLGSKSSVVAADLIRETHVLSTVLRSPSAPERGSGLAKGLRQGQCDCRVTAIALAVALTTVTGNLATGSTAGMSRGTLCMGGTLGPSRVSRIPKEGRMRMSENWLGRPPGQLTQPRPPYRPSGHLPSTTLW